MRRLRANVIAGVMAEIESCLPEAGHRLPESERASCRPALFQSRNHTFLRHRDIQRAHCA